MKSAEELKRDIRFEATLGEHHMRFATTWGIFSPREVDEGSRLLLRHIRVKPNETILDLGCGYGAIGLTLAKGLETGQATLVDKDFVAVEFAKKNAELNGLENCRVMLSNGLSHLEESTRFDTIVSNLPAKVGREMLFILLDDSRRKLNPGGQIVVVTVNGLRKFIKRNFLDVFGNYKKLKQGQSYTVARALVDASS